MDWAKYSLFEALDPLDKASKAREDGHRLPHSRLRFAICQSAYSGSMSSGVYLRY